MCLTKQLLCLIAILASIHTQTGCTIASHGNDSKELANDSDATEDTIDYSDTEIVGDNDTETDLNDGNDNDTETSSDNEEVCDAVDFIIESSPPNLLILLDRSGSMNKGVDGTNRNRWEVCSDAVLGVTSDLNDFIQFGLATFSSCLENGCSPGSIEVPISAKNAVPINEFLMGLAGEGSVRGDDLTDSGLIKYLCDSKLPETSTGASLASLAYETSLMDHTRENAVLLLTDGSESSQCVKDNINGPEGARLLLEQKPPIHTYAVGLEGVNIEEMEAIAQAGGTSKAYYADNPAELIAALREITQEVKVSCTYTLPGLDPKANKDKVNFYFDEVTVGFDKDCGAGTGWNWTDDSKTAVEFCEDACNKMKLGMVKKVSAKFGCETIWVV